MMTNAPPCSCIVDTDGLNRIARASGNLKGILLEHLKSGNIAVPACAWKEFVELYEGEAEALKTYVTSRIIMKRAYYIGAARIADNLNSGFPRGAYDDNVELLTASIASTNGYRILTSSAQVTIYEGMGCQASDHESWIDILSPAPTTMT
jgi:hypothetical protein